MGGVLSVGAIVGFIALFGLSMRSAILLFSALEDLVLSGQAPGRRRPSCGPPANA